MKTCRTTNNKEILDEWDEEDEEAEADASQAEREKRLRQTRDANWSSLSRVESKPVGTNFSTDLIERTDMTIRDWEVGDKTHEAETRRREDDDGGYLIQFGRASIK
jgi:hypothetical protein